MSGGYWNRDVIKSLAVVIATVDGELPATPRRHVQDCVKDKAFCQKFKPEADWQMWEIVSRKPWTKTGDAPPVIEVKGASKEMSDKLLSLIRVRHEREAEKLKLI